VKEVQEEFVKRFPYLKIELYKKAHEIGEGSSPQNQLSHNVNIGNVAGADKKGIINISGLMKVSELEQLFQDEFGISAQVFRQSGNTWLQTTATDSWTLAEQNSRGRESLGLSAENEEPIDYKEQD
jgi:hypothetical protein